VLIKTVVQFLEAITQYMQIVYKVIQDHEPIVQTNHQTIHRNALQQDNNSKKFSSIYTHMPAMAS